MVAGGLSAFVWGEFQGFTWYLVRALVTVPFIMLWWGLVGRDKAAAVAGGVVLSAIWAHTVSFSDLLDCPTVPCE